MRIRITLDDVLVAKAEALTGLKDRQVLLHEALQELIERESARRLARLGGTEKQFFTAPRPSREPA